MTGKLRTWHEEGEGEAPRQSAEASAWQAQVRAVWLRLIG
jgi:hypothetical protein